MRANVRAMDIVDDFRPKADGEHVDSIFPRSIVGSCMMTVKREK